MAWTNWTQINHPTKDYSAYELRVECLTGTAEIRKARCKSPMRISMHKRDGRWGTSLSPVGSHRSSRESIHRLVALTFKDVPVDYANLEVCHRDGDRLNNSPDNLYWGNRQQNLADSRAHNVNRGTNSSNAKNTDIGVAALRIFANINYRGKHKAGRILQYQGITDAFSISPQVLEGYRKGHYWSHLESDEGISTVEKVSSLIRDYVLQLEGEVTQLKGELKGVELERDNLLARSDNLLRGLAELMTQAALDPSLRSSSTDS